MLHEVSSIFVAFYMWLLIDGLFRLAKGPEAWAAWLAFMKHPLVVVLSLDRLRLLHHPHDVVVQGGAAGDADPAGRALRARQADHRRSLRGARRLFAVRPHSGGSGVTWLVRQRQFPGSCSPPAARHRVRPAGDAVRHQHRLRRSACSSDALSCETMHAFVGNWLVKLVLLGIIGFGLWHAAHRLRVCAHDFGIRADYRRRRRRLRPRRRSARWPPSGRCSASDQRA